MWKQNQKLPAASHFSSTTTFNRDSRVKWLSPFSSGPFELFKFFFFKYQLKKREPFVWNEFWNLLNLFQFIIGPNANNNMFVLFILKRINLKFFFCFCQYFSSKKFRDVTLHCRLQVASKPIICVCSPFGCGLEKHFPCTAACGFKTFD